MGSKWFGATILLALAALLLGWLFGLPKLQSLENDIRTSLDAAGYESVGVDVNGFTAVLTGGGLSLSLIHI